MSLSNLVQPARTRTIGADDYDHAINLIDSTEPVTDDQSPFLSRGVSAGTSGEITGEDGRSARWSKGALREELARRKYAKWQESKYKDVKGSYRLNDGQDQRNGSSSGKQQHDERHTGHRSQAHDKDRQGSKKPTQTEHKKEYEVDILYENQRGAFFFGIPLYSSRSLLNFDPASWQTAAFKESPVNITNAQVPDPSWIWAWKSWFVDMSHDVDEEGWEYSFSFRQGFAWHGTHPWFHSFVRRRRWLRKRVKRGSGLPSSRLDAAGQPHMLNEEYFTIRTTQGHSRRSSMDQSTMNWSSYMDGHCSESDSDEEEEIKNIVTLMKTMKKATMDRKKIQAVRNFLDNAGDDIYYLPKYVNEVMDMFLYQVSLQQLVVDLQAAAESVGKAEAEQTNDENPEKDQQRRRKESLVEALRAVNERINHLKYRSDSKPAGGSQTVTTEKTGATEEGNGSGSAATAELGLQAPDEADDRRSTVTENEIKGIPDEAHVDDEPRINWYLPGHASADEEGVKEPRSKGKEKAWF